MDHSVHEIELRNGSRGLLIHVPGVKIMTFQFEFRAGEYLVPERKWETAHILEHMLLGANQQYPKTKDFQAELEKNGAYSNASTGVYDIVYEAECADFEWDRILQLLVTAITKPLLLHDEFVAEFGNVYEELIARSHDRFRRLSIHLREKYELIAKSDRERLKSMGNVDLADITTHYQKTHTAQNMRFIISGNLSMLRRESISEVLNNMDLPIGTGRFELPDEHPIRLKHPVNIHSRPIKNICLRIDTFMNRQLTVEERNAVSLINTLLTETLFSKVFGAAREKGLVYDMDSGYGEIKNASNWWFETQVSKSNAIPLFDIIARELYKVLMGDISDPDLEAAKSYALGRYQRGAQTVRGTADSYSSRYFFDGSIDNYKRIPERIKATTKTSIVNVARQFFSDKIWGLGILSNCESSFAEELNSRISPLWDRYY